TISSRTRTCAATFSSRRAAPCPPPRAGLVSALPAVILADPGTSMPERDFLTFEDITAAQLDAMLALAGKMKSGAYRDRPLAGKTVGLIFAKSSTRTRSEERRVGQWR